MIHFNLTGVLSIPGILSYTQFANTGGIHDNDRATAHELYTIRGDAFLCQKTLFYENGLTIPSASAKMEICSTSIIP